MLCPTRNGLCLPHLTPGADRPSPALDVVRWPAVVGKVDFHGVGNGPLTLRVEVKLVAEPRLDTLGTDIRPPLRSAQEHPPYPVFPTLTKLLPLLPYLNLEAKVSDCHLRLLTDWELDPTVEIHAGRIAAVPDHDGDVVDVPEYPVFDVVLKLRRRVGCSHADGASYPCNNQGDDDRDSPPSLRFFLCASVHKADLRPNCLAALASAGSQVVFMGSASASGSPPRSCGARGAGRRRNSASARSRSPERSCLPGWRGSGRRRA